jgi:PPOX class probable F420-dependent enzyme
MPRPPPPDHLDAFLANPNPSVIGSVRPDGTPHTAATWYLWEGGRVLVNMDEGRRRLRYLRDDPNVLITVLGPGDRWYRQVTLLGRVAELDDSDRALDDIDRISRHYTGQPYGDPECVSAWIEVEHYYSWNVSGPWTED